MAINYQSLRTDGYRLSVEDVICLLELERLYPEKFVSLDPLTIDKDTLRTISSALAYQYCDAFNTRASFMGNTYRPTSLRHIHYGDRSFEDVLCEYNPDLYSENNRRNSISYPIIENFIEFYSDNPLDKVDLSKSIMVVRDYSLKVYYFYTEKKHNLISERLLRVCDDCSHIYVPNNNDAMSMVCGSCYNDHYSHCHNCETPYDNSDSNYCEDCYEYCEDCDDTFIRGTRCNNCAEQEEDFEGDVQTYFHRSSNGDDLREHVSHYFRDPSYRPIIGNVDNRFLLRPVGMEFETGINAQNRHFLQEYTNAFPLCGIERDGSLCAGALEFPMEPMGGDLIPERIKIFYAMANTFNVQLQHKQAGHHTHVDARDIFSHIGSYVKDCYDKGNLSKESRLEDAMITMGNAMVSICRAFISIERVQNRYCRDGFSYRDKGEHKLRFLKKVHNITCDDNSDYPSIALRSIQTLEFRIWPSTKSLRNCLTRVELSQRLTEYMWVALQRNQFNTDGSNDMVIKLKALGDAVGFYDDNRPSVLPSNLVNVLSDLLGLTSESRERLNLMYGQYHLNKLSADDLFTIKSL